MRYLALATDYDGTMVQSPPRDAHRRPRSTQLRAFEHRAAAPYWLPVDGWTNC